MQFEVQIPKRNNPNQHDTVVVEGPNWLFALRDGLKKLGDSMETRNIVCDILGENVVEVRDPTSGRTFSIKEMEEIATVTKLDNIPVSAPVDAPPQTAPHNATEAFVAPVPTDATEAFIPPVNFFEEAAKSVGNTTTQVPTQSMLNPPKAGTPVLVEPPSQSTESDTEADDMPFPTAGNTVSDALPEEDLNFAAPIPIVSSSTNPASTPSAVEQPAVPAEAIPKTPPPKPQPPKSAPQPPKTPVMAPSSSFTNLSISGKADGGKYSPGMTTEILADAFMRAMEIYDYGEDRHAAMQFVLDLALNNVAAAGGAVLLTDINSPNQELWFEVSSGPKSEELLNFRIPMGQGIIGYCAKEGVSQLIADPTQEPRFENDVLNEVGLRPGSILAVPIQHQKRMLGSIVMFNHAGERPFTQGELSILNYLAHTAGEYLINLV